MAGDKRGCGSGGGFLVLARVEKDGENKE